MSLQSDSLIAAARDLVAELDPLRFGLPVTHVYNPLEYAWEPHAAYLRRYAAGPKRVIFVGMNPGPYGMAQTGVPFGEIASVRDWLAIAGEVGQPPLVHPKRPIDGFACARSEGSGKRLWGAIAARFGTPETFFARHFVANYCPLVFMEASGLNRTPDKLPTDERVALFAPCDRHLQRMVTILDPEWVIGVGRFAEARAREALAGTGVKVGRILHPSPASPAANRDWQGQVTAELAALGSAPDRLPGIVGLGLAPSPFLALRGAAHWPVRTPGSSRWPPRQSTPPPAAAPDGVRQP